MLQREIIDANEVEEQLDENIRCLRALNEEM